MSGWWMMGGSVRSAACASRTQEARGDLRHARHGHRPLIATAYCSRRRHYHLIATIYLISLWYNSMSIYYVCINVSCTVFKFRFSIVICTY